MSVPTVVTVVQSHRAALLAREQATMQAAAARWLGVETALNAQVDALALELARTDTPTWGQLVRSRRYAALREQVNDELRKYAAYMDDTITRGQRNMAIMALEHSAQAVNAAATQAGIVAPFDRISIAAVEDMIGLAGDGSPLRVILNDAAAGAGDALGQQLVNGIALGRNPITVARQAMRLGLGQSFTRMQLISRTEQLRVYRTTTLASYANSRVVVAYKRISARDRRTCFIAGTMVATPDGDKPIESICVGDTVLTHQGARRVASVMVRPYSGDLVTYQRDGIATTCTPGHPIWVGRNREYKWLPAEMLRGGDKLMLAEQVYKHLAGNGGNRSGSFPTQMDRAIPLPGEKGIAPSFLGGVLMPVPPIGLKRDVIKQNEVDSIASRGDLFAVGNAQLYQGVLAGNFQRRVASVCSVAVRGTKVIAVNNYTGDTAELFAAMSTRNHVRRAAALFGTINPFAGTRPTKLFAASSTGKTNGFFCSALHRANRVPVCVDGLDGKIFVANGTVFGNVLGCFVRQVALIRAESAGRAGMALEFLAAFFAGGDLPFALENAAALPATTHGSFRGDRSRIFQIGRGLLERLSTDRACQFHSLIAANASRLRLAFRRTIRMLGTLDSRRVALDRSTADGAIDCNHASIISQVRNRLQVKTTVYDLEVEDAHTYFANGALVHNCPACLFADGQQYPIEHGFDEHPAGRCSMIPVLANVPPVRFEDGQSWFRSQPESVQRAMLGPGRFDLWQRGEASLTDMVSREWSDTWGGSLRVTNVGRLRGGGGRVWAGGGPVAPAAPQVPTAEDARQRIVETTAAQRTEIDSLTTAVNELKSEITSLTNEVYRLNTESYFGTLTTEQADRYKALPDILYDRRQRMAALQKQLATTQRAVTETARTHLRVKNPADVKWIVGRNAKIPATWQEGLEGFNELVDSGLIREGGVEVKAKAGRAYYSHDKIVRVQKNEDTRTVVHELGHWLEHTNPEMHDKILEFYDRRTAGEELKWLGKGYSRDEKTRRDKFISPYMGKEYMRKGVRDATEILSMGLEYMHADPVTLALKDPDYFDFIFNLVRGNG